jgi:hypothetical protein
MAVSTRLSKRGMHEIVAVLAAVFALIVEIQPSV